MATSMQRSICSRCNKVVFTDEDYTEVPYVALEGGTLMHAECYDQEQEEEQQEEQQEKTA